MKRKVLVFGHQYPDGTPLWYAWDVHGDCVATSPDRAALFMALEFLDCEQVSPNSALASEIRCALIMKHDVRRDEL